MVKYGSIIVADGIPTIKESIQYLNKIGLNQNSLCISLRSEKQIFKYVKNNKLEIKPFYKLREKNLKKILLQSSIILFSESNQSISTQFIIGFILKNNIKCKVHLIKIYPFQDKERSLLHFLNYPGGYNINISNKIRLFFKLILFKIFNLKFRLLSKDGCKATFICPQYQKLNNLKTTKIIPDYRLNFKQCFKKVVYFHGGDVEESLYCDDLLLEFKFVIEQILCKADDKTLYIKLHPNINGNSFKKIIKNLSENSFKYKFFSKDWDYSEDLLLTTISTAIFRYNCFKGFSLFNILKNNFSYKNNIHINYKVYFDAYYEFFQRPAHIFQPNSLSDLLNLIQNPISIKLQ